jgi:hypothetical protein
LSGRRHRTPQNDKVDGRDCHVTTFLAMTDLDRYFHPHLVQQRGMKVYPDKKGMGKKQTKKKRKAHPPESPLNGGINSAIPLLGGVPFYGGEGAFWFFLVT